MYTLDASVLINAVESAEPDHVASRQLIALLRTRAIPIIVPTLALAEVAGTISRLHDAARGHRMTAILLRLRAVSVVALDISLARVAAQLAADHRLRGADAVYAALAQRYGTTLVSRDNEHLTRLVGIIPVQHPVAALAALMPPSTSP